MSRRIITAGSLILLSLFLAYSAEVIVNRSLIPDIEWGCFLFSAAVMLMLMAIFLAVTGRVEFAFGLVFAVTFILACISCYKMAARGEPLYLSDLAFVQWIFGVVDRSNVFFTKYMAVSLLTAIILTICLFFLRIRINKRLRCAFILAALPLSLLIYIPGYIPVGSGGHGAVSAFYSGGQDGGELLMAAAYGADTSLGGIRRLQVNEDELKAYLEGLKPEVGRRPELKPNVIILLSESFWDITGLPLAFSEDPVPNFKRISKECVSGKLMTYTFGGGTANVEFEMLTGCLNRFLEAQGTVFHSSVKEETFTIARVFKELGYRTVGLHTNDRSFYNRDKAFPLFGFDEWIGLEDISNPVYDGKYVSDVTLTDMIINELKADGPQFIMAISMENHQPYGNKYPKTDIKVSDTEIDGELKENVESFLHGLSHADKQLARLVEYIENDGAPTALLFFGDHQPTLGSDFYLHRYVGDMEKEGKRRPEDFQVLLTTQYLIWSNYKHENTYEDLLGVNFLGNRLLNYLDFPKPLFFYYLDDVYANYFHFLSRTEMYIDEKNVFGIELPEERRRVLEMYWTFQRHMLIKDDFIGDKLRELY